MMNWNKVHASKAKLIPMLVIDTVKINVETLTVSSVCLLKLLFFSTKCVMRVVCLRINRPL